MSFTSIPNELILEIANALPCQDLSVLSRTNSHHRHLLTPLLLRRAESRDLERCITSDRPTSLRSIFSVPNPLLNLDEKISGPGDLISELPLNYAAQHCSAELVATIIALGAAVDNPDPEFIPRKPTSLQCAVLGGNIEIVVHILDAGALIDRISVQKRCSPLSIACFYRLNTIAHLLIDRGAQLNGEVLVRAAYMDVVPVLERVLDRGTPVDSVLYCERARQPLTVLQFLCMLQPCENRRSVGILLRRGADVNKGAGGRWSPLAGCVRAGNLPSARLLIDFGVDRGEYGDLVAVAKRMQNEEMVQLLLRYGR